MDLPFVTFADSAGWDRYSAMNPGYLPGYVMPRAPKGPALHAAANLLFWLWAYDDLECDELVTLVLAAAETTSSVLASVFYRLSENPDVCRKVCAEIDEFLAGASIQYEDVRKLPYTLDMLCEVLRLDMPADWFMRRATKDVVLGDTLLPAGSELIYSIPALHLDPDVYDDPYCAVKMAADCGAWGES